MNKDLTVSFKYGGKKKEQEEQDKEVCYDCYHKYSIKEGGPSFPSLIIEKEKGKGVNLKPCLQ